jgi:sirohydrochlorin cobaltochelatase
MQGLILFAHGARDPRWAQPFERAAQRLRELAATSPSSDGAGAAPSAAPVVALAYLEFLSPDLAGCAAQLIAQGCTAIEVLPVFLGAGGHVRKDLPAQVQSLRAAHPQVAFTLHTAAGESAWLEQAIAQWAWASVKPEAA